MKAAALVSNSEMRRLISFLCCPLLAVSGVDKPAPDGQAEKAAIQRAKNQIVSSFDRTLPNVTLEFFLNYEAEGAAVKWEVNDCGEQFAIRSPDRKYEDRLCVEADFDFEKQISVTVVVSVGALAKGAPGSPALAGVTITDHNGQSVLQHLSDLPKELHRPYPRQSRPVLMSALKPDPSARFHPFFPPHVG
jgi:hypothetical protein